MMMLDASHTSPVKLGWIGAGKMGEPMIRRLVAAGHKIRAYDVSDAGRAAAANAGAALATSYADIVTDVDFVVSMIPNDDVLRSLCEESGPVKRLISGQVFVDMSTVSPAASHDVVKALPEGVTYLRAPVSGSTVSARNGDLKVLVSGPRPAFDRFATVAMAFASATYYLGEDEQARFAKLALNIFVGATAAIMGEVAALAECGGLSREALYTALSDSAISSPLLAYKRSAFLQHDYRPAFSVSQMLKDFTLITSTADANGVAAGMPITRLIRQQLLRATEDGRADLDFFVIAETLKQAEIEE